MKFAALISTLMLLASGCSATRPLHRSEARIRVSLLKRTPFGTPKAQVERFIAEEGWRAEPVTNPPPPGELHQAVKPDFGRIGNPPVPEGMRSMLRADFGRYGYFVGTCYVSGCWGFDAGDHLLQVWVQKERDGL